MINRKKFLQILGTFTGATFFPDISYSKNYPANLIENSISSALSDYKVFDLHCHPAAFFRKGTESYMGDIAFKQVIEHMNINQVEGVFISIVADLNVLKVTEKGVVPYRKFEKNEAWNGYQHQLNIIKELLKFSEATTTISLQNLNSFNRVGVFISCEGADFLEGDIANVDKAYKEGVRSIQLVHYAPNDVGDLQTAEPLNKGLSAFGKEIVKRMNELGMVVDVAHASFKTVQDVADITSSPIILSHSILKKDTNEPINARAITEEHAKVVAETGGIIGVWPSGLSANMEEFVESTLQLIEVVGINHVGLGTDMDANYKPVIKDYNDVQKWIVGLEAKGLRKKDIEKIAGGNAKRVLKKVLKQ